MLLKETTLQETNRSSIPHPLRVMFVTSCMDIGGAEIPLASLVRRMDRTRFLPATLGDSAATNGGARAESSTDPAVCPKRANAPCRYGTAEGVTAP